MRGWQAASYRVIAPVRVAGRSAAGLQVTPTDPASTIGRVDINAATVVQPYLPTRYWLAWIDFFRQPVFWRDIQRGFGIQAVYVVVFLAAAWANFSTKDITA
jgi:hypothetical protein